VLLQWPFYQPALAFLAVLALAGSMWLLASQGAPAGVAIVRPTPDAHPTPASTGQTTAGALLDINSATAAQLAGLLPGIGPVLSERIVAFRQANGPFVRIDQIMTFPGIGDTTFANIGSLITVEPAPGSTTNGE